jgi:hypothetical protein
MFVKILSNGGLAVIEGCKTTEDLKNKFMAEQDHQIAEAEEVKAANEKIAADVDLTGENDTVENRYKKAHAEFVARKQEILIENIRNTDLTLEKIFEVKFSPIK